jgi:AraC-like DNA-binding protein
MSISRQDNDPVLVRSYGVSFSDWQIIPPASESWDQLIYASRGVLTVSTELGTWVVPPHRAVWLPANVRSTLSVSRHTALRMIYVRRRRNKAGFDRGSCAVVSVSPLLRELIIRTNQIGALASTDPRHRRIAGLIDDELQTLDTIPLQLPYPQSKLAQSFASSLTLEGDLAFDVPHALNKSGASRRTIERLFRAETGMSLGQWVRRRKLLVGLEALLQGDTTGAVAFRLGYNGPSAFIAMFRRELGETPGNYIADRT